MRANMRTVKIGLLIILFYTTNSYCLTGNERSGVGIILGNPTGLSFKFLDNKATHFNAALSWSFKKESDLHIHVDYIFKRFNSIRFSRNFAMSPTMGIGSRLKTKEGEIAVRVPFSLLYNFKENPFDIFLEIVPTLDLVPATNFEIGAALALRYLF